MDRTALLQKVLGQFGGATMNPGQQIASNQVTSDMGYSPQEVSLALAQQQSAAAVNNSLSQGSDNSPSLDFSSPSSGDSATLKGFPITQAFGNYNPADEVFSKGFNSGLDIGVPKNTPIALPSGKWKVLSTFTGAKGGYIGDNENSGYGNSVLVQNVDTGEKLRFSHLSQVHTPSDTLQGGQVIGYSGATGNVTGPHLDLEYYNKNGQLSDFMQTPYAKEVGL